MSEFKSYTYTLTQKTDELKKLILENPDLPIAVLAGEEANNGYFGYMFCTDIEFSIGEILDCDFRDYDDAVFTDRGRLEEYIEEDLYDKYSDKSVKELAAAVEEEVKKYEPYWKDVIMIWADN